MPLLQGWLAPWAGPSTEMVSVQMEHEPPGAGTGCLAENGALGTHLDQKPRSSWKQSQTVIAPRGEFQQVLVNSPYESPCFRAEDEAFHVGETWKLG